MQILQICVVLFYHYSFFWCDCRSIRGRIVNVYGGFGFLKKLGDADGQDIFFRAADVIGSKATSTTSWRCTAMHTISRSSAYWLLPVRSPMSAISKTERALNHSPIGMNSLDPGSPSTECLSLKSVAATDQCCDLLWFVVCGGLQVLWKIQPRSGNCAGKYKVWTCDSVVTQVWSTVPSEAPQVTFCTGIPTDSESSTSPWKMKSPLSCRRTNQLHWLSSNPKVANC